MGMKPIALLVALVLVAPLAPAAERYLVNATGAVLYVAVEQPSRHAPDGPDLDPGGRYRQVPPGGALPIRTEFPIAGFAFSRGSFDLPTFTFTAEEATGRTTLTVTPDRLSLERVLSASTFAAVLSGPRVDNEYLEWVRRPKLMARARGRAPMAVFADFGSGREPIDRDDSLLWSRAGTDLQWIAVDAGEMDVFVAASTYSEFGRGTTMFVYLYGEERHFAEATLEIPVGSGNGFVLLWLPIKPEPIVVGNFVGSGFLMEAQVWTDVLSEWLATPLDLLDIEFATASSAAGVWEEFVLARTSATAFLDP